MIWVIFEQSNAFVKIFEKKSISLATLLASKTPAEINVCGYFLPVETLEI